MPVWKSKFYDAFVLNHIVVLHAIDATPARWHGDADSSPLDGTSAATPSLRNDLVKYCRVHLRWLISTQITAARGDADARDEDRARKHREVWKRRDLSSSSLVDTIELGAVAFSSALLPLALDMEATTLLGLPSCRTPSKRRAWRPGGWRARGAAGRHGPVRIGGRGSLLSRRNGALPYSTGDFKWVVNCLLVCFTDAKTRSRSADTRTVEGARSHAPSLYPAPERPRRRRELTQ